MAVHTAQKGLIETEQAIERISNISMLKTPSLVKKEELHALYKKLECMQSKARLLDQVVDDDYSPVTEEIIEDIDLVLLRISALI